MLSTKDEQAEHGPIRKFTLKRLFGLGYVIYDDSINRPFNEPSVIVNIFYHKKLKNLHENMIHLRMTGRLLRILVSLPEEKHKHLIFQRNHEKGIALLRYPPFWAVLAAERSIHRA